MPKRDVENAFGRKFTVSGELMPNDIMTAAVQRNLRRPKIIRLSNESHLSQDSSVLSESLDGDHGDDSESQNSQDKNMVTDVMDPRLGNSMMYGLLGEDVVKRINDRL